MLGLSKTVGFLGSSRESLGNLYSFSFPCEKRCCHCECCLSCHDSLLQCRLWGQGLSGYLVFALRCSTIWSQKESFSINSSWKAVYCISVCYNFCNPTWLSKQTELPFLSVTTSERIGTVHILVVLDIMWYLRFRCLAVVGMSISKSGKFQYTRL